MISFVGARPSDDEIAAIVTVLQTLAVPDPAPTRATPAWALAMRHNDLDYDELHALVFRQGLK
jgi:hypothetical protein